MKRFIYSCISILLCVGICRGACCGSTNYVYMFRFKRLLKDGVKTNTAIIDKPWRQYGHGCCSFSAFGYCTNYKHQPTLCRQYKCNKLNRISAIFNQPVWTGILRD